MGNGIFFSSRGDALYGFVHPAQGGPHKTGVLFVHGAFEERQDAHLILRDVAESLAADGFPALRFDLYGHGDSAGDYHDATLSRWTDDVVAAAGALREHTGCTRVAIVGLRLGAAVAARAAVALAARGDEPAALVLWSPVVRGTAHIQELLRGHLAQEMVMHRRAGATREELLARLASGESVNLFGYPLTRALHDEVSAVDLGADLARVQTPTLLVDVVRTAQARGSAEHDAIATALGPRARVARVAEAQPLHAEGKLFYARAAQVSAATREFLAQGA